MKTFLRGWASAFNLFPTIDIQSDEDAIRSDWDAVLGKWWHK